MRFAPTSTEVERFRACLARRLGLVIEEGRLGSLVEILGRRAARESGSVDAYLALLDDGVEARASAREPNNGARASAREPNNGARASARTQSNEARSELRVLAQELTITETYFFRNTDQMRAFADGVLPALARAGAPRKLRILCAGCASGEEPYSLAILLREQPHLVAGCDVSIVAIDINPAALEKAGKAIYSTWSLRDTPEAIRTRWFRRVADDFVLSQDVRNAVRFEERNLVEDDPTFWQPAAFDVVFCRNVTMYFSRTTACAVMARIARSLVPAGFLFLGHAETLRGLSQDFHLRHTHDTFYYQRRETSESTPHEQERSYAWPRREEPLAATLDNVSWVEAIRVSSQRIQSLSGTTGDTRATGLPAEPLRALHEDQALPTWSVALVVELLRKERFAEAKALLSALPPEAAHDPDVLLLQAVLYTHGGNLASAETLCAELISRDETNAGAHYLTALCREQRGDSRGAVEQDQIAVYLDPSFAMPRLHLGLLARRSGDTRGARREFSHALVLLEREDAARLLLFGGGFARDALLSLCRAELSRCGAES